MQAELSEHVSFTLLHTGPYHDRHSVGWHAWVGADKSASDGDNSAAVLTFQDHRGIAHARVPVDAACAGTAVTFRFLQSV
jgi:hypothetical protein